MGAIFCNRCGHRNPEGANFCSSCGSPLERFSTGEGDPATTTITLNPIDTADAEEEVTITLGEHEGETGVLVVTRGPTAGSRFALTEGKTTIGRSPDSDVFLDDVTVSRRHAEVTEADGRWTVTDAGSLNGTYLNRERIEQAEMRNGDELMIGKFRLVFVNEIPGG